ncbi:MULTISPECIES: hypothetical protein [unclassified Chryseobacterium]|uniref:hypothetical protein n=1 Tax=unclassified Chryseobacterium TaxID=2593645 RepID=UPI00300FCF0A
MRKNLFLRLFLLIALSISLYSCIHDDMSSAADPVSKEYENKSLWREDEKYIHNVKKVFDQYADKSYFSGKYGNVLWDYALTMGTFDESFLEVPISRNGKVNSVLTAERRGNRVFFKIRNEKSSNDFFDVLVFKDRSQLKGNIISGNGDGISSKTTCYTVTVTWTWTSETTGEVIDSYVFTKTRCTSTGPVLTEPTTPGDCLEEDCTGGGTGGGGYPYTETQTDPCEKMKEQNSNQVFKDKVAEMDKKDVFDKDEETGFAAAYGTHPFEPLANTANDNLKFPPGNKYFGYIHTHLDSKEGVIKIFSPADVFTFLTGCVRNAETNGTMADAYGMVITSQGNYILKYSGDGNYGIGTNTKDNWQSWYEDEYVKIMNEDGTFSQNKVEKLFTRFLVEKVKIDGLELYKSDKTTGNTERLEYNATNMAVQTTTCP